MSHFLRIIGASLLYAGSAFADYVPSPDVRLPEQRYEQTGTETKIILDHKVEIPQFRDNWENARKQLTDELHSLLTKTDICNTVNIQPEGISCMVTGSLCNGGSWSWDSTANCETKDTREYNYDKQKWEKGTTSVCSGEYVCSTGTSVTVEYNHLETATARFTNENNPGIHPTDYGRLFDIHTGNGLAGDDNLCLRGPSGEAHEMDLDSEGQAIRAARLLENLRYVSKQIKDDTTSSPLQESQEQAQKRVIQLKHASSIVECFKEKYPTVFSSANSSSNDLVARLQNAVDALSPLLGCFQGYNTAALQEAIRYLQEHQPTEIHSIKKLEITFQK